MYTTELDALPPLWAPGFTVVVVVSTVPIVGILIPYSAYTSFANLNFRELLFWTILLKKFRKYAVMVLSAKIFVEIFSRMASNSRKSRPTKYKRYTVVAAIVIGGSILITLLVYKKTHSRGLKAKKVRCHMMLSSAKRITLIIL